MKFKASIFTLKRGNLRKIAILRALKLGDLLCAVPAFRSLRKAFPKAEISLIGLPWSKAFVERFPHLVDRFIEFPGFPGLLERKPNFNRIFKFLTKMQQENFDLILQMQGNGTIANSLVYALRGDIAAGYWSGESYCPNPDTFMLYPQNEHEIKKHLLLMQFLDIETLGADLEFPISFEEEESFPENLKNWGLKGRKYAIVHAGAQFKRKRWLPQNFAKVADYLSSLGYQVVLTGVKTEKEVALDVLSNMVYPAINLAGKTDLGQIGLLIKNASILVSNDTGICHIAPVFQTPSLVVSKLKDPAIWVPLSKSSKVVRAHEAVDKVILEINGLLGIGKSQPVYFQRANL